MATKKQIAEDIRQQCGNLVSFGKVAKYLGMSPHTAREFLEDVPCYCIGRKRCFFAIDLASKLICCEQ